MLDPIAELIRMEVSLAKMVRDVSHRILTASPEGAPDATIWSDYGFKWPAYALAHLYRIEHPDNPFTGEAWCLDLALSLVDKFVGDWHYRTGQGLRVSGREVPHYIAAALLEWLGDRVDNERRAEWTAHAEAYAVEALERPMGFTGNYHDTWRMLALFRMGQAHDRAEWREMALLLFHQMIALQTDAGFWEEGRHHGPSMRYNGLMLPTLAWMYRLTGDEQCGNAARRLARFMAAYSYPDAITVGPFDGRNSPMLAFFPNCAGLELAPEGRVLSARAFGLWCDLGAPENMHLAVESTRDAVRLAFYTADTCVYLSEHVPAEERAAAVDESGALPVDRDGTVEHHSIPFDGILHRQGPWIAAISGQNSGVPRQTQRVFRLERESRIEVWHQTARLVLGGGHNLRQANIPHANAVLDTGYAGPADFGRLDSEDREARHFGHSEPRAGGAVKGWRPEGPADPKALHHLSQPYYMPRVARSRVIDGVPELTLIFGHGTVRFRVMFPSDECCEVEALWDVKRLNCLCLQLPVVVWLGADLSLDGVLQSPDDYALRELKRELRVEGGPFGSCVTLTPPEGVPCRVHYPLRAQPSFSKFFEDDPFRPQFAIALVSCQWAPPEERGRVVFAVAACPARRAVSAGPGNSLGPANEEQRQ